MAAILSRDSWANLIWQQSMQKKIMGDFFYENHWILREYSFIGTTKYNFKK